MGFSIGKAFGGLVKSVLPKIIQTVTPAATSLLQKIAGSAFTAGGAALSKLASSLPGPFAGLAQRLLGQALPKLQQLANNGIENLIGRLAQSVTSRFAPDVGNVSLPGAATRIQDMIANNPVSSTSSAATSSAPSSTSSSSSAATSSLNTSNPVAGGDDMPPAPLTGKDAESISKQNEFNAKMQSYQARLSAMNRYWEMMSNIYKTHDQTARGMAQNLR